MEKKIKSLRDLTERINSLSSEYSMADFGKSFKRRLSRMKIRFWESMSENKGLVNPVQAILTAKNSLTDGEMNKVLRVMEDLKVKYRYDEYIKRCDEAREEFLSDREEYFSSKMGKPITEENSSKMSTVLHDMLGVSDLVICNWLDSILGKIKPEVLGVDYEDLDGNIKNVNIRAEPIKVTKDYVSAPLIDRYTGSSQFDSFLLRSFFDADEKEWIYIPVRFIISVKSANTQINSETL